MATTLSPLRIVIAGVDQYSKAFNDIEKKTTKLANGLKQTGTAMSAALTLPILGGAFASVKLGADFDYAMRKMQAKTSEVGVTFAQLRAQAKQLGAETQFTAQDAAKAMEGLGAAGWNTSQIFQGLPGIMTLAAAGDVDMATAADIAMSTMNAFGLEAKEAARVSDILATTANASAVSMQDIGESMKYAAPVARSFGANVQETSAAIAFLGNIGIKGTMAGTGLASMFARLAAPSDEAAKMLNGLGIKVADASGKMKPFNTILGDLSSRFGKLTQQQQLMAIRDIFGIEAMKSAAPLIAEAGGQLEKLGFALNNVKPGAAQDMVDIMTGGATGSFLNFQSAIEGLGIALAESGLLDAVAKIATAVAGWASALSKLDPRILQTALIFAGFVAIIGPVLLIAGNLVATFVTLSGAIVAAGGVMAILASPIVGWVAAIVGAGIALTLLWDQLKPVRDIIMGGLMVGLKIFGWLWETLGPALMKTWESFKKLVQILAPFLAIFIALQALPVLAWVLVLIPALKFLAWILGLVAEGWGYIFDGVLAVFNMVGKLFAKFDKALGGPFGKFVQWLMGGKGSAPALPKLELPGPALPGQGPLLPGLPGGLPGGLPTFGGAAAAGAGAAPKAPAAAASLVTVQFVNTPEGTQIRQTSGPKIAIRADQGFIMQGAM